MSNPDIRAEIAERRSEDVVKKGAAQGLELPASRQLPLIPFLRAPSVICEVKRRSPSVSDINLNLDPVRQAQSYRESGIKSISVLTEQNYFGGSLEDLLMIKTALPDTAVLRKDFLLTEEDVDVSFRAGADAFLLIASLLDEKQLRAMYEKGRKLGMTPVVELHSEEDIAKASAFKPGLVGVNSRDLRSFRIKPLQPLKIRAMVDWDCRIIYESGIKNEYDIDFVRGTGFDAVLVGEAAVRNTSFAGLLSSSFSVSSPVDAPASGRFSFWKRLYSEFRPERPLVKICGITNTKDLAKAADLGADIAGFILADSPRKVAPSFIEGCRDTDILKVGVVVLKEGEALPEEVAELLESGALDAIQFHGGESSEEYLKWPGYKAVRIKDAVSAEAASGLPGPAVLADAFSSEAFGGTGKRIEPELVRMVASGGTLWLAGGINPSNVCDILTDFRPELIDVSSGLESSPGIKDHDKLERLFDEIRRAGEKYRAED